MRFPIGRHDMTADSTAAVPEPVKITATYSPSAPGTKAVSSFCWMRPSSSENSDSRWQISGRNSACRTRSDTLTGPGLSKITCELHSTCEMGLTPLLFDGFHEPSGDGRRIERDAARVFHELVDLDQQHARPVLFQQILELVD